MTNNDPESIRVVHVSSAHQADDIRIFRKEAKALAAAGYDVHLVAIDDGDSVRDGVHVHGLPRSRSRWGRFLFSAPRAVVKAARLRGSLYHLHDPELLPWFLLLPSGASLIFDSHEDLAAQARSKQWIAPRYRPMASKIARLLERLVTRWFDAAIVVTPAMLDRFKPLPTVLVRNLPIGSEWRQALDQPVDDDPYVAFVGGIWPSRGVLQMTEAIALVSTDVRLVLAGPARGIDFVSAEFDADGRVQYEGIVSRAAVGTILGGARAGLLVFLPEPNHVHAMPNKLFEYMSAGLPVIASDFPLWRGIVEQYRCGLLVDPLDPASIAEAVDWIIANPEEARCMGCRGRSAIDAALSWEIEKYQLLSLYDSLN